MTQLYQTALPAAQANTSDEGVRAQIQQSGLLQEGGTATEKIASENIDLVIEGEIELGATFAEKIATEIESIGESDYSGIPLYTIGATNGGRNAGYYEVEQVDVSPAHPVTGESYQYTVGLKSSETRQDKWTAVATNVEDVETGLATGSNSLIGLPSEATKARWYSESSGKENASVSSTVSAEFGSVDLYDPTSTSITNPILLYELAYEDSGDVDVRVYDDKNVSKTYSVSSGGTTVEASQWPHAYHTSYEFEGDPVVDNGLHRLRYDEPGGVVELYEWNDGTSAWDSVTVSHTDFSLVDADFTQIGPADVRVYGEFVDDTSGALYQTILSHQRGLNRPLARGPEGSAWTSAFETYLGQFCSSNDTDPKPTRVLKARGGVK